MRTRWILVIAVAAALFTVGAGFWQSAPGGGELPDLAGVYKGEGVEVILARHPLWGSEYIGQIVYEKDLRVQPMKIACDIVKGCHGVIYDAGIAEQSAVELKIAGDTLTFRHYRGPTLVLKREKRN